VSPFCPARQSLWETPSFFLSPLSTENLTDGRHRLRRPR